MMRKIGTTDISVTPVAMGCWPIAGMTSIEVYKPESLKTLSAAQDAGINFFDTAYCYGAAGESEMLIGEQLLTGISASQRDQLVIATKGGIHWDDQKVRHVNGRPEKIQSELDESLIRLGTDRVELLYHHAPDPNVPIAESAGAFRQALDSGKALSVGVSNYSVEQIREFQTVCPVSAVQPPYNMLQREIEKDLIPFCRQETISVICYWPLMKGLLAGKLARDHQFAEGDGRAKYPMFQGEQWQLNQDFVDQLRLIAKEAEKTVSQVVINWTMNRPGMTSALCGAKRDYQIRESAGAMGWSLSEDHLLQIEKAILARGEITSRAAV